MTKKTPEKIAEKNALFQKIIGFAGKPRTPATPGIPALLQARLTRFCRSHRSPSDRRTTGVSPHHTMPCTDVGGRVTDGAGSSVAAEWSDRARAVALQPPSGWCGSVVAKTHFPWTKVVMSSDEKRRSSRSLPGPFAAEQPTDASYLSRLVRCAPASDEAPRGPSWQIINRRTRRPKFHDERPATSRCLLALPTEASSFPSGKGKPRDPPNAACSSGVNWICICGYNHVTFDENMRVVVFVFVKLSRRCGLYVKKSRRGTAIDNPMTGGRRGRERGAGRAGAIRAVAAVRTFGLCGT